MKKQNEDWYVGDPRDDAWLVVYVAIGMMIGLVLCMAFCGCTPQREIVTVQEIHHEVAHQRDTIHLVDSFFSETNTIIREVDSAQLADLGLCLDGMQRAFLIERQKLQREMSRLRESHSDTVRLTDTIYQPVYLPAGKPPDKIPTWRLLLLAVTTISVLSLFFYIGHKVFEG